MFRGAFFFSRPGRRGVLSFINMIRQTEPGEIFDVVDEHDCVIGEAPRAEVHARQLRHRAVHVLLFNGRGEVFIQKRAASKDTFPRCYDSSASGHLNRGEDYDSCARREIQEELGLVVSPEQLRKHFKMEACEDTGWEFVWVYSVITDEQPTINPQELESGGFWTREHTKSMLTTHPERFARSFVRVFTEFEGRGLWPRHVP
jgi:isopentenyl-diphosphate delta-isomerase type 1